MIDLESLRSHEKGKNLILSLILPGRKIGFLEDPQMKDWALKLPALGISVAMTRRAGMCWPLPCSE